LEIGNLPPEGNGTGKTVNLEIMKLLIILLLLINYNSVILFGNLPTAKINDGHLTVYQHFNLYTDTINQPFAKITLFHLEIIPPSSGVQFYKDGILFLSNSKNAEKMMPKHLSFGSTGAYNAPVNDSVPGEFMAFAPELKFRYPIDGIDFTNDFNTLYFTRISSYDNKEKIYKATYSKSGWIADIEPLSFCSDNYIYTHPALSNEGSFMIFSSDQMGSTGGLDLFISRKTAEKWSKPENLGEPFNTSGNEIFASLDAENNLYFSSAGLPGFGGYDIFLSRYYGTHWGNPKNLTSFVNTRNDEIAFTINRQDGKSAFFTSRDITLAGKQQLYRIIPRSGPNADKNSDLTAFFFIMAGINDDIQPVKHGISVVTISDTLAKTEKKVDKPTAYATDKNVMTLSQFAKPKPADPGPEISYVVIYRVQLLANSKPVGSYVITVAGKSYTTHEYLYAGAYRTTIGEFSTMAEAKKLQNTCRQSGYNQAFIAAFKNNIRSTDPELFK
jgi:hypothetical protein